ncbi:MAG: bifunctional oligoribonuclease/PAP phosphatase NrnA [Myxococcota bacterium]
MNMPSSAALLDQACRTARRALLTGPMFPDGDSIGACLAMAHGLRLRHPDLLVDVAGDISFRYAWMPGADQILPDDQIRGDYDLAIVLDGDQRRLEPPVKAAFQRATVKGIVDHHSSTTPEGYDLVMLDHHAASTCEMVYAVLKQWGIPLDPDLASLLYTGLIFDTGGFRHSNTTAETHRFAAALLDTGINHAPINVRVLMERRPQGLKLLGRVLERAEFLADGRVIFGVVDLETCDALGCAHADVEGIVDSMVFTHGVELACLCVEKGPGLVKLSLRSREQIDVADLARQLHPSGGGHPRAAGVMLRRSLTELKRWLTERLSAAILRAAG